MIHIFDWQPKDGDNFVVSQIYERVWLQREDIRNSIVYLKKTKLPKYVKLLYWSLDNKVAAKSSFLHFNICQAYNCADKLKYLPLISVKTIYLVIMLISVSSAPTIKQKLYWLTNVFFKQTQCLISQRRVPWGVRHLYLCPNFCFEPH